MLWCDFFRQTITFSSASTSCQVELILTSFSRVVFFFFFFGFFLFGFLVWFFGVLFFFLVCVVFFFSFKKNLWRRD